MAVCSSNVFSLIAVSEGFTPSFEQNAITDDQVVTTLFTAAKYGHINILDRLFQNYPHLNIDETDYNMDTAMHKASQHGRSDSIEWLISHGGKSFNRTNHLGYTPLELAVFYKHEDTAKILIKLDDTDKRQYTKILFPVVESNNIGLLELILELGHVNINVIDRYGDSSLHCAIDNNNLDIVTTLLKWGANPNIKNGVDMTPLHKAKSGMITELLLQSGCVTTGVRTFAGRTPLSIAVNERRLDAIELLVRFNDEPLLTNIERLFTIAHSSYLYDDIKPLVTTLLTLSGEYEKYDNLVLTYGWKKVTIDEDTDSLREQIRFRVYFSVGLLYRLLFMTETQI